MPASVTFRRLAVGIALFTCLTSCDDATGPRLGAIRILTSTIGSDVDTDGYGVQLDGDLMETAGPNGSVVIGPVAAGRYTVRLNGIASNCALGGAADRAVVVTAGDTVAVNFAFSCVPRVGTIRVRVTTAGTDLDPDGYTLTFRGTALPVGLDQTVVFNDLREGVYSATLGGTERNCTTDALARSATVSFGTVSDIVFDIVCAQRTGHLRIVATTTGNDLDPDGYGVRGAGGPLGRVASNGSTLLELPAGDEQIALSELAANCTAQGENPRGVTVPAYDTATVAFNIVCAATTGSLRIVITTSGTTLDPDGYYLSVGEYDFYYYGSNYFQGRVGIDTTLTFSGLPPGDVPAQLIGVAGNCSLASAYQTATIVIGQESRLDFAISCVPLGSLHITTVTTGIDASPTFYTMSVSGARGNESFISGINDAVSAAMNPGRYSLNFSGLAPNCDLVRPLPDSIDIVSGSATNVAIEAGCVAADRIAYVGTTSGNRDIHVVKSNRTSATRLTTHSANDEDPDWEPGGNRIAFTSDRSGNRDVYVMNADGTGVAALTTDAQSDYQPAWSPDGARIAFVSTRDGNPEIYVMNADGTNPVRLTTDAAADEQPAWSPDGTRIAFRSTRGGGAIFTMGTDGSGVSQLTQSGLGDARPAWSPDGATIAFSRLVCSGVGSCSRQVLGIAANGSAAPSPLLPPDSEHASWSRDARFIAYTTQICSYSTYVCYPVVVIERRATGEPFIITSEESRAPAWVR